MADQGFKPWPAGLHSSVWPSAAWRNTEKEHGCHPPLVLKGGAPIRGKPPNFAGYCNQSFAVHFSRVSRYTGPRTEPKTK